QRRPRSSQVMATGLTTSGSEANRRISNPSGNMNFFRASAGESAGVGAGANGPVSCLPAPKEPEATMRTSPARRNKRFGGGLRGDEGWQTFISDRPAFWGSNSGK